LQKYTDLPVQLATSATPLKASVVLASFGSSQGLNKPVFSVALKADPNAAPIVYEKPLRYGKREEIHHTFRADPKNPPKIISAFFTLAVLATVPVLFVSVCFCFPFPTLCCCALLCYLAYLKLDNTP
jgi:oligosaccharyltransferase complex subunit delta (ribophorin II)